MKILYSLLLSTLLCSVGFAQSFSLSQDSVRGNGDSEWEGGPDVKVDLMTESESEVMIEWKYIGSDAPAGWAFTICDNKNCYADVPVGEVFECKPITKSEKGFFKLNVFASKEGGSGSYEIEVYEKGNPDEKETLMMYYDAWFVSTNEASAPALNTYPNPATSMVFIDVDANQLGSTLNLYNMQGAIIMSQPVVSTGQQRVDVSQLPAGIYHLQLRNSKGVIGQAKIAK